MDPPMLTILANTEGNIWKWGIYKITLSSVPFELIGPRGIIKLKRWKTVQLIFRKFYLLEVFAFQKCHFLTDLLCETFVSTHNVCICFLNYLLGVPQLKLASSEHHRDPWYLRMCPATELRGSVDGKLHLNDYRWLIQTATEQTIFPCWASGLPWT